jgi:hypothetical protein
MKDTPLTPEELEKKKWLSKAATAENQKTIDALYLQDPEKALAENKGKTKNKGSGQKKARSSRKRTKSAVIFKIPKDLIIGILGALCGLLFFWVITAEVSNHTAKSNRKEAFDSLQNVIAKQGKTIDSLDKIAKWQDAVLKQGKGGVLK